jgi:hypothetical protein
MELDKNYFKPSAEFEKEYLNPFPEQIPVNDFPLYIVAGNYREAKFLADSWALRPAHWRYVEDVKDLLFVMSGSVCFYGTYYRKADSSKTVDFIKQLIDRNRLVRVEISERHE